MDCTAKNGSHAAARMFITSALVFGMAGSLDVGLTICALAADFRGANLSLDGCSVIVTGTDMRSRPSGLSQCLLQVFAKVSGDPRMSIDPRAVQLALQAGDMVESYAYFDRESDVPLHDEQGTRDRPFDLVVHFDPAKVDAALRALHGRPWRSARPALLVSLAVQGQGGESFVLSADGAEGERLREALFAAGGRFGMRVVLLPGSLMTDNLASGEDVLKQAAKTIHSARLVLLSGKLEWSDADHGWDGAWTLTEGVRSVSWKIGGVSFDEAFRNAVGGSTEVLSGAKSGVPQ